jgi:hypothetical protein
MMYFILTQEAFRMGLLGWRLHMPIEARSCVSHPRRQSVIPRTTHSKVQLIRLLQHGHLPSLRTELWLLRNVQGLCLMLCEWHDPARQVNIAIRSFLFPY